MSISPRSSTEKYMPMDMSEAQKRLILMQVFQSTWPVGTYSHSYGLETMISDGRVHDAQTMRDVLTAIIDSVYELFDGPAFCRSYQYGRRNDTDAVIEFDDRYTAMCLTREKRKASAMTGKAFLRACRDAFDFFDIDIKELNYTVAAGMFCGYIETDLKESLEFFLFNGINSYLQVGIKSIPLGQSVAQSLIAGVHDDISSLSERLSVMDDWECTNYLPVWDIMSMQHEGLYSRLYMS